VLNDITNGSSEFPSSRFSVKWKANGNRSKLWHSGVPGFEGMGSGDWTRYAKLSEDVGIFLEFALNYCVGGYQAKKVVILVIIYIPKWNITPSVSIVGS